MINLQEKSTQQFLLFIAIIFLIVLKLENFMDYFKAFVSITYPFLIGIGIAFILNRPMVYFEKQLLKIKGAKQGGLVRVGAIMSAYILFFIAIYIFFSFVVPELVHSISQFFENSDAYINNLTTFLVKIEKEYKIFESIDVPELIKYVRDFLTSIWSMIGPRLIDFTRILVGSLFDGIVALIFSMYLLVSKEQIFIVMHRLTQTYTSTAFYTRAVEVCQIIIEVFNKYVLGQLMEAALIGSLCFVGMIIFKFDYALLISMIVAVTSLIPVFGAFFGGGVAVLLLLLISPSQALYFAIYLIVLQQIESNFIYPQLIGSSLGLPPILVMVAVIIGGNLLGFVGMLIGVPITTVIYTLIRNDLEQKKDLSIHN